MLSCIECDRDTKRRWWGRCSSCKQRYYHKINPAGKLMELEVDHNHQTNVVRKLLCHACNVALGFLDENPDRMRKLAEYVELHQDVVLDKGKS